MIYVVACVRSSLKMKNAQSMIYCIFFFIHTSISGHLDCFLFLAIAIPLRAWIYQFLGDLAFISLWYIPASGIAAAAAAKLLHWCLDSVRPHR